MSASSRICCRLFGHLWKPRAITVSMATGERTVDQEYCQRCRAVDPPDPEAGTCPSCGRSYWPDFLHLDCPPQPATSDRSRRSDP